MPKVAHKPYQIVCVRHRHGWCATRKKTTSYQDHVKTVCGMVVTLPWQIEFMGDTGDTVYPDCPDCLRILGLQEGR